MMNLCAKQHAKLFITLTLVAGPSWLVPHVEMLCMISLVAKTHLRFVLGVLKMLAQAGIIMPGKNQTSNSILSFGC